MEVGMRRIYNCGLRKEFKSKFPEGRLRLTDNLKKPERLKCLGAKSEKDISSNVNTEKFLFH